MELDPADAFDPDVDPRLLLRLGEQECYTYLKSESLAVANKITPEKAHKYAADGATQPDPFEGIDVFCLGMTSLTHLAILTLLKFRMHVDLQALAFERGIFTDRIIRRPDRHTVLIGDVVRARSSSLPDSEIPALIKQLNAQYRMLMQMVDDANPHFWDVLFNQVEDPADEVDWRSTRCSRLWEEALDAASACAQPWHASKHVHGFLVEDVQCLHSKSLVASGGPAVPFSQPHALIVKNKERRVGGKWDVLPSLFDPKLRQRSPSELFPAKPFREGATSRFIYRDDPKAMLVYSAGSCANSGWPNAQGAWATVYGSPTDGDNGKSHTLFGRLETEGPDNVVHTATSNRAELRGVIAALRGCLSISERGMVTTLVIATDSSYVINSADVEIRNWIQNGKNAAPSNRLKTDSGQMGQNGDLWGLFLGEHESLDNMGVKVVLWKIPTELNLAKHPAMNAVFTSTIGKFRDIIIGPSEEITEKASRILAINSSSGICWTDGDLVNLIASKPNITLTRVFQKGSQPVMSPEQIVHFELNTCFGAPLSAIIILDVDTIAPDAGLRYNDKERDQPGQKEFIRKQRTQICSMIIRHLRAGATVILAGPTTSNIEPKQDFTNYIFRNAGLPWHASDSCSTDSYLRPSAIGERLAGILPVQDRHKACLVENVHPSHLWYKQDSPEDDTGVTMRGSVAFTKVGLGRLGFVGDSSRGKTYEGPVLAMLGLLDEKFDRYAATTMSHAARETLSLVEMLKEAGLM